MLCSAALCFADRPPSSLRRERAVHILPMLCWRRRRTADAALSQGCHMATFHLTYSERMGRHLHVSKKESRSPSGNPALSHSGSLSRSFSFAAGRVSWPSCREGIRWGRYAPRHGWERQCARMSVCACVSTISRVDLSPFATAVLSYSRFSVTGNLLCYNGFS